MLCYFAHYRFNCYRNRHLLHVANLLHVDQGCEDWHYLLVNPGCSCLLLHGAYCKEITIPIHLYLLHPSLSICHVEPTFHGLYQRL
jgi:hypothetical protein